MGLSGSMFLLIVLMQFENVHIYATHSLVFGLLQSFKNSFKTSLVDYSTTLSFTGLMNSSLCIIHSYLQHDPVDGYLSMS